MTAAGGVRRRPPGGGSRVPGAGGWRTAQGPAAGQDFVHVSRLRGHPANIRASARGVDELAASVRRDGILEPLIVTPDPQRHGCYQVVAGHRRLAAARLAGLGEVPVVIRLGAAPAREAVRLMLVENCQRDDLDAVERARAMGWLRSQGMSPALISRETGLSPATVSYHLELLELDARTLQRISSGRLTAAAGHAAVKATRAVSRPASRRRGGRRPGAAAYWTAAHPLADRAAGRCRQAGHPARERLGKVACGPCWEAAVREDERCNGPGGPGDSARRPREIGTPGRTAAIGRDEAS